VAATHSPDTDYAVLVLRTSLIDVIRVEVSAGCAHPVHPEQEAKNAGTLAARKQATTGRLIEVLAKPQLRADSDREGRPSM
jgi:hypothetical protein